LRKLTSTTATVLSKRFLRFQTILPNKIARLNGTNAKRRNPVELHQLPPGSVGPPILLSSSNEATKAHQEVTESRKGIATAVA